MTFLNSSLKTIATRLRQTTPALLIFVAPAEAADNALMPSWTGAYIGAHGGVNWREVDLTTLKDGDDQGAQYGAHAGYNLGLGAIVLGVEGDASYEGSDLSFNTVNGGTANLSADWSGSLRGRFGVPIGPVMMYATAGWAWTETKLIERTAAGSTAISEDTISGPVYGLGVEAYLLPGISARAEFLNYDYGGENLSFQDASSTIEEIETSDRVFRLGISVKLN